MQVRPASCRIVSNANVDSLNHVAHERNKRRSVGNEPWSITLLAWMNRIPARGMADRRADLA